MKAQIEKMLKENGIKYLTGKNETKNIFTFSFIGIKDEQNRIVIYMELDKKNNLIVFRTAEEYNKAKDINELKTQLLDFNARLATGTVSMSTESNLVEYRVNYHTEQQEFDFYQFIKRIACCIFVYETLKEEELIV